MKKFLPLWAFLFLLLATASVVPAFADGEWVTVTYFYGETEIASSTVEVGVEVKTMSYTTAKNLLIQKGIEPEEGVVYEWRKGSEGGEAVLTFIAQSDVNFYYVPSAEIEKTCTITYRYDYLSEDSFSFEEVSYSYGEAYSPPKKVNGKSIELGLYLSPEYGTKSNNLWNVPTYVEEDMTVYVILKELASITLNGKPYVTPYGISPVYPSVEKNYGVVGFFTDAECTQAYNGPCVNGLVLYYTTERVSYTLTTVTPEESKEWTIPISDNTAGEDILSKEYVWCDEEGNMVSAPYLVTGDVVLTGSDKGVEGNGSPKKGLTKEEIVAIVIVSVVFAAIGTYALIVYLKKKGKLKLKKKEPKEGEKNA